MRRLRYLGAQELDLVDIYTKQIRSILELAVPVWHGGITLSEQIDLERVQRSATHIILGDDFVSYREALKSLGLETLKDRRDKLCLKFGKKAEKHSTISEMVQTSSLSSEDQAREIKILQCCS